MFDTKLVCFESTYGTLLCECLLNGLAATQPPHFLLHCNELEIRSTKRFFFFSIERTHCHLGGKRFFPAF